MHVSQSLLKGSFMVMLFDDNKKPESQKQKPQGILEIFFAGVMDIVISLFKGIGNTILGLGAKFFGQYFVTLGHLLDFRGLEREVATRRIAIAVIILAIIPGIPLYYLYKVPAVRDYLTLSKNITVNVAAHSGRLYYPDSSYFIPEEKRRPLDFRVNGALGLYYTFPQHEEGDQFNVLSGVCQMVTRGKSIKVASLNLPTGAEGFDSEVTYYVNLKVTELNRLEYTTEIFLNPRYVLKSKEELLSISTTIKRTRNWHGLQDDWDVIETFSNNVKAFTVQARDNQHGIICF